MMKFVIIQCAEAHHHEMEKIFEEIHINAYSEMPVDGFMKSADGTTDISNWFGSEKTPYRYILAFALMEEQKSDELLQRIKDFNEAAGGISPLSAYVSTIEKYV